MALLTVTYWLPPAVLLGASTISYVQCNYATPQTSQSTVSITFTAAQAAGDLNVIAVGWNDSAAAVNTVTDKSGNTYVRAVGPTTTSGTVSQSIYYAKNIAAAAAGANIVTVTFSTAATNPDIRILEYKGADASNPVDVTAAASGNSTTSSTSAVTTTNPTDLLFGANLVRTMTTGPGSGFTSRLLTSPDGDIAEDRMVTATGSYSATAPLNQAGAWVMQMVAFRTQTVSQNDTAPPSAPTNLTATVSGAQINLNWTASTDNVGVTGYRVQRCQGAGCTAFAQIGTSTATTYSDTSVGAGSYSYRVQATDAAGNLSGYSNTATGILTDTTPPTAPANLTATASGTQINLNWSASTDNIGVTQYLIQRCPGAGCTSFAQIGTSTATTYSDTSVGAGSYSYRVQATDAAGNLSPFSNTVSATTASASTTIAYVQGSYAVPQTAQTSVSVTFTAAQAAGDLNVVAVGWNDGTATVSAVTDKSGNTYTRAVGPTVQSGVASQSIYYAKNIVAAAAGANVVTIAFSPAAKNPDIRILEYRGADPNNPVDVTAASSGSGTSSSSGSATTTNATDLLFGANLVSTVTSGPGNGFTNRLLTTPDGDIAEDEMVTSIGSYAATAPLSSGQWIMQMVAFRTTSGVTTPPTAPSNLTANAASTSQINLSWTASTSNGVVANYIVQRCQGAGCTNFAQIAAPHVTSYNDTGLLSGTSYSYRAQAVDTSGNLSTFSNTATAITQTPQPPTAPSNLTAAATGASQINLSWTASTSNVGLAHYIVQRCQGAGCANFAQIATPAGTVYTDTGLSATTSYSYRVQAIDTAGNTSTFSNTATVTTQAGQAPTAPGNLTAAAASGSQINLSWIASTSNVGLAHYIVQRCQGAGCTNFAQLATPTGTTYNDTGLASNTSYTYQAQAVDTAGNTSTFSNTATATTGYLLPLKASSNNRYLVDQNGTPFLMMGDSPQAMVGNLGPTDMATYMADRQRLGFNTLWVNLLCDTYTFCNSNGTTYNGVAPFTSGSSPSNYALSTPNSAYFSIVDSMLNLAATYNMVVFLDPIETGGWLVTLDNNGTANAYNYGVYIGTRYKNFTNIVWINGNDFQDWASNSTDNNLVKQVMAGIASVDSSHLQTIELEYNSSYSTQDAAVVSLTTLNSAYTYSETYDMILQSYNSSPTIPTYLVESNYEYENNTGGLSAPAGPYVLREQAYWTMLSGGIGQIFGNHYTTSFISGWQSHLDGPADLEIQYINQLFGSIAWWNLVPDQTHQVVTAGYGAYNASNMNLTSATYCTTSWIRGSLALTYCPNAASLTVNLSEFSGPVTAQWYDPSNGAYTAISGSPFPGSGTHVFATPGNNHDGNPDWVLVLHI